MAMLDRATKNEIMATVRRAVIELRDENEEVWLREPDFLKQFGMFNHSWMKTNGHLLPRTQAIVTDENGKARRTGWAYPRNRIQKMVMDGSIKQLCDARHGNNITY